MIKNSKSIVVSELTRRISVRLMQDISSGRIAPGAHVGAQSVAARYGVSRTPVREALETLEKRHVLVRVPNRGYFVVDKIPRSAESWLREEAEHVRDDYQRLADDWLANNIPEEVTEQFLRQRFGWTKAKVNDLLARASREGWVERKEGYGWRFLQVAKTADAFDEIFRFRMTIEPAAMLEPSFRLDRKVLQQQRQTQERMLESDGDVLSDQSVLHYGSLFHEELIKLSGNPFFLVALQRVNRMRRLMEHHNKIDRSRLLHQCEEHLKIIEYLEDGDIMGASREMREHLSRAVKNKTPLSWTWVSEIRREPA